MEQNSDVYMHSHSSPDRIDDTDQHAVSSYDHTEAPSRQHHDSDSSDSDDGSEGNAALLSQNDETWDTSDVISDVFDQRVRVLAATLESVESKCILLSSKLTASEEQAVSHMNRLEAADRSSGRLRAHNESLKDREQILRQEVSRLQAQMQTCRIDTAISGSKLQQLLEEERLRTDRMRSLRDNALMQRDDALSELASAYADLDGLQSTLTDSAVYVRYLRKKVLELEMTNSRLASKAHAQEQRTSMPPQQQQPAHDGSTNTASIRANIFAAVSEAFSCSEEERKRKLRQLQLRWHPDKNPVLADLATEVSKMINEAITRMGSAGGLS